MVIGSGGYNLKIERQVVRRNVLRAVAAIEARGETVFAELVSPAFPYRMPDGYLFVMDMNGRTIVDPAYPGVGGGRDMSLFRDAVGVPMVATVDPAISNLRGPQRSASNPVGICMAT